MNTFSELFFLFFSVCFCFFIFFFFFFFFIFYFFYFFFFFCYIFLILNNNILLVFLTHVSYSFSHNRLFNVSYHVFDILNHFYFMIVQMILILFFHSFI